jgi:hypothetical protein
MAFKLTIDMPNLGPDDKIAIMGLGEFQNGKSYEVSDELADSFRQAHSSVQDKRGNKGELLGTETVLGPPLDEVEMYGVEVEALKETPKPANQNTPPKEGDK